MEINNFPERKTTNGYNIPTEERKHRKTAEIKFTRMRSEQLWNERIRNKVIQRKFPPRVQRDLSQFPVDVEEEWMNGIFVWGPVNTGKSILVASVLLEEERRMYLENLHGETYFVNTSDLFQELKETYMANEKETNVIHKYRDCRLLVLDDFGTNRPSDWVYNILYLILNYRYENLLPTCFSSNISLEDIQRAFSDERIPSRIERMCKVLRKKNLKKLL